MRNLGVAARRNRRVDREHKARRRRAVLRAFRLVVLATVLALGSYQAFRLADARDWFSIFQIREVRVVGARVAHPTVLVAEAGLMGEDLRYWSPLAGYAARVERDPLVEVARLERSFPNRLVLVIEERTPIALLKLERLTPVDAAGRVLPVSPFHAGWDAPIMMTGWQAGEVLSGGSVRLEPVRALLTWLGQVVEEYPALYGEISAIELDERGTIVLHLVSAEGTIVLDRTTPMEKLLLIDDVLRDLRAKGLSYERLDLRFEDQIVVQRS
ncbi:MAG TPA: FtsQ-type POTRA domain-containing protein [Gemmatimonadota bacterium]|nr:FtsQ-type POTRA domain-containing protein [Gemmatimonadota bacterium]